MRQGTKAEIELKPRCSRCEDVLEHTSCIECQKPLLQQLSTDGDIIYCFGPKGENWHMCENCYTSLDNLKCPKCGLGQEHIGRYAKDTKEGVMIVNTCKNCIHIWETKRGIK